MKKSYPQKTKQQKKLIIKKAKYLLLLVLFKLSLKLYNTTFIAKLLKAKAILHHGNSKECVNEFYF